MTENRSKVIDIIEDEVRFTKTSLKEVSVLLVNCDAAFNEALSFVVADQFADANEKAFVIVLKSVVNNIVLSRIDGSHEFWTMVENQVKRQRKN